MDFPRQQIRRKSVRRGHLRHKPPQRVVQKRAREGERAVHADADVFRELQRKPAPHPEALHHDDLAGERGAERGRGHGSQFRGERFKPVAGMEEEAVHESPIS